MCLAQCLIFVLSSRKRVKFLDEINKPDEELNDSSTIGTMLTELKSDDTSIVSEELQGTVIIIYSVI